MKRLLMFCHILLVCVSFSIQANTDNKITPSDLYKRYNNEHYIGHHDPVATFITYDSMSCPHCSSFALEVLPRLIQKYKNDRVMFIRRDYPLDAPSLRTSALIKCLGHIRGEAVRVMLMDAQPRWVFSKPDELAVNVHSVIKSMGINLSEINSCMNDEDSIEYVMDVRNKGTDNLKISATPSHFLNGKRIEKAHDFSEVSKAIDAILRKEENNNEQKDGNRIVKKGE